MKKLIFFSVLTIILSGCSLPSYYVNDTYIDYSELTSKGIFVTESNSVNFEYESKGSLSLVIVGGYEKKLQLSNGYEEYVKKYKYPDINDAFYLIEKRCKAAGANGILNLKIQYLPTGDSYNGLPGFYYSITGMLIKKTSSQ
jgi:hypothetical protein